MGQEKNDWQIWVDTGGTFTDCIAINPKGEILRTKILSNSRLAGKIVGVTRPNQMKVNTKWDVRKDIFEGYDLIIRGEQNHQGKVVAFDLIKGLITIDKTVDPNWPGQDFEITANEEAPILACRILTGSSLKNELPPIKMRLGSTKGTNALLERKGAKVALLITKGFKDLLLIGNQQRPNIFELDIKKRTPLVDQVIEIAERVDSTGKVLESPDPDSLGRNQLIPVPDHCESVAICFLNSYVNPEHENMVSQALRRSGCDHISISHRLAPMINILTRCETTVVNAYLAPLIEQYVGSVSSKISKGKFRIMTSAGGLVANDLFEPKDSLFSGPAGGVVGAAATARISGLERILSFDMGGTSTDVSRYNGEFDYQFESEVGDAKIFSPSISIKTVAAGGGSVCTFDGLKFMVGPESAGASPGPACYGCGGPLTITDVNLLLGRLDPDSFGIPLSTKAASDAFQNTIRNLDPGVSHEQILTGFLDIANEKMAGAIRSISIGKGFDPSDFTLLPFGGAGGQHGCQIAELLNIDQILIPSDAGLLSAFGIGRARIERFAEKQVLVELGTVVNELDNLFHELDTKALDKLSAEGFMESELEITSRKLFLRFKGQDTPLEIDYYESETVEGQFKVAYQSYFAHWIEDRPIEIESARVVASTNKQSNTDSRPPKVDSILTPYSPLPARSIRSWVDSEWRDTPVFDWTSLRAGASISGPALLTSSNSTTYIKRGWSFQLDSHLQGKLNRNPKTLAISLVQPEQIQLELFTNRFSAIADAMGQLLQRTAFSVNIKERLDFSCAILDHAGELVVNAPHIPVHLGSLGVCTRRIMEIMEFQRDDVVITNHPGYGGSHLPDITLVAPVYSDDQTLIGFVANRAHHAELGGISPGSMPTTARNLQEEGVIIPPMYLVKNGISRWEEIRETLLGGSFPTRAIEENLADIKAALASIRWGQKTLSQACTQFGKENILLYMDRLKEYASVCMANSLKEFGEGYFQATEKLDDGTPICTAITIENRRATIDFASSGPVHAGNLNANPAIVASVVLYVLRLLINRDLPLNEGLMKVIELKIPQGILNPAFSSEPSNTPAVVGGNTETSQRLTDTLLKALGLCACSQGTMNNLVFGNKQFGYYETIAGGVGAGPGFHGQDAVHQHMTNTRITDPEVFEKRYPARILRFKVRENSGGSGKWNGGNGVIREILFLDDLEVTILSQHRVESPYGMNGGSPGKVGKQFIRRMDGTKEPLAGMAHHRVSKGDRLIIKTPGGGGYGSYQYGRH